MNKILLQTLQAAHTNLWLGKCLITCRSSGDSRSSLSFHLESIQLIHVDVDQLSTESLYPTFSLSIPVSRQSSRLHLSTTKVQSIPKTLLRYTVSFMVFSIVTFPGLATAVLKYILAPMRQNTCNLVTQ